MEWIRFKERTPFIFDSILCAWNGKAIHKDAWFDNGRQEWVIGDYDCKEFKKWAYMKPQATHYMLYPEPPKED